MTAINLPDDGPKAIRETLAFAQTLCTTEAAAAREYTAPTLAHVRLLQRMMDECDRHRPLGPDGKHGNRHTPTCGCEHAPRRKGILREAAEREAPAFLHKATADPARILMSIFRTGIGSSCASFTAGCLAGALAYALGAR